MGECVVVTTAFCIRNLASTDLGIHRDPGNHSPMDTEGQLYNSQDISYLYHTQGNTFI